MCPLLLFLALFISAVKILNDPPQIILSSQLHHFGVNWQGSTTALALFNNPCQASHTNPPSSAALSLFFISLSFCIAILAFSIADLDRRLTPASGFTSDRISVALPAGRPPPPADLARSSSCFRATLAAISSSVSTWLSSAALAMMAGANAVAPAAAPMAKMDENACLLPMIAFSAAAMDVCVRAGFVLSAWQHDSAKRMEIAWVSDGLIIVGRW
eukprot:CAMPEP_0181102910 /NCGR_PEP_ID=MMETSP1071-20121207/14577_1 /TAXON_ID=35127 /ORGANISM="Thalassiosira sp., Strain NH16" /LENGTH=214 /DNA_ID=CAMNT_0023185935 /DNA_START=114 /DNA_END=754 /DNA_ORIENTATION=-